MITPDEKQDIYEVAHATMLDWYGPKLAEQGACLYINQCAMRELHMRGHRVVLQAGDLLWRIVPDYRDDGTVATHFGYEFDLSQPFSQEAVARGLLPEVHVWCALPDENCVVDFSTQYLPGIAKERHGFDWLTLPPPEYVFGQPPPDACYRPTVEAIEYVWKFIQEKLCGEVAQQTQEMTA